VSAGNAESRPGHDTGTAQIHTTSNNTPRIPANQLEATESADLYEARLQAWAAGWESRQGELDYANERADTYYEFWLNPGEQLTDVRERRMLAAAEIYWCDIVTGVAN
jgi:hypothetical protein